MRYADILNVLKEAFESDLKASVLNALMALKIQGIKEVCPQKIIADFHQKGINIGIVDLLNFLKDEPLVKDANRDNIIFSQDDPDDVPQKNNQNRQQNSSRTVSQMAKSALTKMGD